MPDTLVEFECLEHCRSAALRVRGQGLEIVDAYLPFPDSRLLEILPLKKSPLPKVVAACALLGGVSAYLVQWWTNSIDYPLNIGGRPGHPPASFLLITFETPVLFGALGAFFGFCYLCRLPRPHHPLLDVPGFERASVDRYFLLVRAPRAAVTDVLEPANYARMVRVDEDH